MQFLRKAPILRIVIPYFLGIIPSLFFGLNTLHLSSLNLVCILGLLVILLGAFQLKTNLKSYHFLFGSLLFLFCFFLGIFRWNDSRLANKPNFFEPSKKGQVVIKITDKPLVSEEVTAKIEGEIIGQINDSSKFESKTGNCILYFKEPSQAIAFKVGDVFILPNKIQKIPSKNNPWGFDYPQFLARQNIHFQGFYSFRDIVSIKKEANGFVDDIKNLRISILESYFPYFQDFNSFSVFAALVLGNKETLNDDLSSKYANAGTMHVLAVSGLHVGILYFLLGLIFKRFKKRKILKWIAAFIQITIIWIYALITGLSPSIFRAATMFSCLIIGDQLNRNSNIYNTLGISALILTLSQPELLASIGFQLSYLAVIGILLIYPDLYNLFNFKHRVSIYFWGLVCVSIAAQLAVLPLSIYYFNQIPSYFLLANILVIPIATINLTIGLLASVFYWLNPFVLFFSSVLNYTLWFQNFLVEFIASLPFSFISGLILDNTELFSLYFVLIGLVFLLVQQDKKWLRLIFGAIILMTLGYGFEKSQTSQKNQVVVFSHPKAVYLAYNHQGESSFFCFGPRDSYFEKYELTAFAQIFSSKTPDVIEGDSICDYFIKTQHALFLPNLSIGVGEETIDSTFDYLISTTNKENLKLTVPPPKLIDPTLSKPFIIAL